VGDPGANVTVVSGANVTGEIQVNQNASPTTFGHIATNSSGYLIEVPGYSPQEGGENDTLGAVALDQRTGTLFVANGTFQNNWMYENSSGQEYLHEIVAINNTTEATQSVSVFATFPNESVSALVYDPMSGELYVSTM